MCAYVNEPPVEYWIEKSQEYTTRQKVGRNAVSTLMDDYYQNHYDEEIRSIVSQIKNYIDNLKREELLPQNASVVFDVDDTLLSTSPAKRNQFLESLPEGEQNNFPSFIYPPILSVCQLYNYLRELGLKTLILTGRYDASRDITEYNLKWVGITDWDDLVMRKDHERELSASVYKSRHRAKWSEHYLIVANIGDQFSDLTGPFSGYSVKLPNLMYHIE